MYVCRLRKEVLIMEKKFDMDNSWYWDWLSPENNVMHLRRELEELNAGNGVEYDIIEEGDQVNKNDLP